MKTKVATGCSFKPDGEEKRVTLHRYIDRTAPPYGEVNSCFFRRLWYHPQSLQPFLKETVKILVTQKLTSLLPLEVEEMIVEITDPNTPLPNEVIQLWLVILYAFISPLRDSLNGTLNEAVEFLSVPYLRHCLFLLMSERPNRVSPRNVVLIWLRFVFDSIINEDFAFMYEVSRGSAKNTIFSENICGAPLGCTRAAITPRSVVEWESFTCDDSSQFRGLRCRCDCGSFVPRDLQTLRALEERDREGGVTSKPPSHFILSSGTQRTSSETVRLLNEIAFPSTLSAFDNVPTTTTKTAAVTDPKGGELTENSDYDLVFFDEEMEGADSETTEDDEFEIPSDPEEGEDDIGGGGEDDGCGYCDDGDDDDDGGGGVEG